MRSKSVPLAGLAALPQHMAVSLRLTVKRPHNFRRLRLRFAT
jgi:hypothetical protein